MMHDRFGREKAPCSRPGGEFALSHPEGLCGPTMARAKTLRARRRWVDGLWEAFRPLGGGSVEGRGPNYIEGERSSTSRALADHP